MTKRRKLTLVAGGTAVIGIIIAVILFLTADNQGQITPPTKQAIKTAAADKTLDDQYIRLQYKGMYGLQQLASSSGDLELYALTADTDYKKTLSISVDRLPSNGLDSVSAQQLRKSQPSLYTSSQRTVDGGSATVWVKYDGTEQTVLIPHGQLVAQLTFNIADSNITQDLPAEVDQLLQSFHWQ